MTGVTPFPGFILVVSLLHKISGFAQPTLNDRPIIGILTQPMVGRISRSYIAASNVKFAETAGARVVPVHFNAPDDELRTVFRQINGLILPGGWASVRKEYGNRFRDATELLFNLTVEANSNGDSFPIYGICLGLELLSVIVAQDDGVLCERCYQTMGVPLPLDFTPMARESKLFSAMSSHLFVAVASQNLTVNAHYDGVTPEQFEQNLRLKAFFQVLSTNKMSGEAAFVSTVEARHMPITATQWHPEKTNFEWGRLGSLGYDAIPHSSDAVLASQYIANDFVSSARKSPHRFTSSEAETEALISNFFTVPDPNGHVDEIYMFDRVDGHQTSLHSPEELSVLQI
eukprot:TRINITY_DN4023_c1_g1_i1.p1 TRINITY_DN4023_c1_g1~~TRINITY_DN4023_c1_g1_i1.p1  ORF type:complete len:373 (-),score=35.71 TRINITY_DN4023_c1_g1_i1:115-1146(-)